MSPDDIKNSFEARAHAVEELRRLVEDSEGAEFSAEQQAEYERQNEAIDALDESMNTGAYTHLPRLFFGSYRIFLYLYDLQR